MFLIIFAIVYAYIFAIKFLKVDVYFMNINPYVGGILSTITKYSGVDYIYSYFVKKGAFGEEEKQKEIEKEIFELENEFDMV